MARELMLQVPSDLMQQIRGYEKIDRHSQAEVVNHSHAVVEGWKVKFGADKDIGRHLFEIRRILSPHKLFEKYIKNEVFTHLGISRATVYRSIQRYENLSSPVVGAYEQTAIILGKNPVNPERVKAKLMTIEAAPAPQARKPELIGPAYQEIHQREKPTIDEEALMLTAFRHVQRAFDRLPAGKDGVKKRSEWMRHLMGMQLRYLAITEAQTIHPQDIPDRFRPVPRGRPKKNPLEIVRKEA